MIYLSDFYLPSQNMYNSYENYYPYNVFCNKELKHIEFDNITIFYGSNGSGKSTLLNVIIKDLNKKQEVIKAERVKTNEIEKPLYAKKREVGIDQFVECCESEIMGKIPIGSELISSEDIFNFIHKKRVENTNKEIERKELDDKYWFANSKWPDATPISTFRNDMEKYTEMFNLRKVGSGKKLIESRVEKNAQELSNGQTSLDYYNEKLQENTLYFLDEPENSLAPEYQLELVKLITEMTRFFNCQFIIATHSPFVLAMPGAKIYDLDSRPVITKEWYELDNMKVYYSFFNGYRDKFELAGEGRIMLQFLGLIEEKGDVVFMRLDELNKEKLDEEIQRKILQSEDDYNNGRVRDAEEVFKEWEEKYKI